MYDCPLDVYSPSEDSYFLSENVKIKKGAIVADVGCGSGIQSLNALSHGALKVYAIDLNQSALDCTVANCKTAGHSGKIIPVKSDLFAHFSEKVDCIIFNPPYVESSKLKYAELDGGKRGREVLDRFLAQMPAHLKEGGVCFFLQTELNGHEKTQKILQKAGLEFRIVAKKRGFFEELAVYECSLQKRGI